MEKGNVRGGFPLEVVPGAGLELHRETSQNASRTSGFASHMAIIVARNHSGFLRMLPGSGGGKSRHFVVQPRAVRQEMRYICAMSLMSIRPTCFISAPQTR